MYRAYGGWTFAFKDYLDQNITKYLDDPRLGQLTAIVDPYGNHSLVLRLSSCITQRFKYGEWSTGVKYMPVEESRAWGMLLHPTHCGVLRGHLAPLKMFLTPEFSQFSLEKFSKACSKVQYFSSNLRPPLFLDTLVCSL